MTQSLPSNIENANLVAKILTSKQYSKKLANQSQNYQFIQADQSQSQKNLRQVQINIPNQNTTSCQSDYFTFSMQMTISDQNITTGYIDLSVGNKTAVVQYKNGLYLITIPSGATIPGQDLLKQFVDSIENTTYETANGSTNTKDYGVFIYNRQVETNTGSVVSGVQLGPTSGSLTTLTDTEQAVYANTDATLYGQISDTNAVLSIGANTVSTSQKLNTVQYYIGYQKVATLPATSASFIDETALKHQNTEKGKALQMQKRYIYRLQYDPNVNQETMNQRWYEYYSNNYPQIIYAGTVTTQYQLTFTYTVMIKMSKLFDIFQTDFLCLFKLANPLQLTVTLNTSLIQSMFKVNTCDTIGGTKQFDVQFIKYNQITFYSIGCYLLNSSDLLMEKKLQEEIESLQGIILPIEQTYIEIYDTSIGQNKNFQISQGFNSLDYIELGLVFTNNRAYYNSYSTLKDILGEYADLSQTGCQVVAPQKDSIDWYIKQYSFMNPQIQINGKSQFIGASYINNLPFFLTINNRSQTNSDSNPLCYNQFDYYNKLNIRLCQFTDSEVQEVEPNELNYSGQFISRMQNSYYNVKIANYMVPNIQSDLQEADSTETVLNGQKTFKIEAIYHSKAILKITREGNLELMQQEYQI